MGHGRRAGRPQEGEKIRTTERTSRRGGSQEAPRSRSCQSSTRGAHEVTDRGTGWETKEEERQFVELLLMKLSYGWERAFRRLGMGYPLANERGGGHVTIPYVNHVFLWFLLFLFGRLGKRFHVFWMDGRLAYESPPHFRTGCLCVSYPRNQQRIKGQVAKLGSREQNYSW